MWNNVVKIIENYMSSDISWTTADLEFEKCLSAFHMVP